VQFMPLESSSSNPDLSPFLQRYPAFDSWQEEWDGVPLEFRVCLSEELPQPAFVGSVRAIVIRGNQVLLFHSNLPILSVGGRCEPEESIQQTLLREVAEETGWTVTPLVVIGFIHARHLDSQRPAWNRPAPDFIDPLWLVSADFYDAAMLETNALASEFVAIDELEALGVDTINRTFLREGLRKIEASNMSHPELL